MPVSKEEHLYFKYPENNYVPAIPNINRKNDIINKILDNSSFVFIKAKIIYCRSGYFVTVRSGLKTRTERKIFKFKLTPLPENIIGKYDVTIITKSRIFHDSLK